MVEILGRLTAIKIKDMANHGPEAGPIIPEDVVSVVKLPAERGSLRLPLRRVLIGAAVGGIALPAVSTTVIFLASAIYNQPFNEIVYTTSPLLVAGCMVGAQVGGFIGSVTSR